jgi:hypothetical protein
MLMCVLSFWEYFKLVLQITKHKKGYQTIIWHIIYTTCNNLFAGK